MIKFDLISGKFDVAARYESCHASESVELKPFWILAGMTAVETESGNLKSAVANSAVAISSERDATVFGVTVASLGLDSGGRCRRSGANNEILSKRRTLRVASELGDSRNSKGETPFLLDDCDRRR